MRVYRLEFRTTMLYVTGLQRQARLTPRSRHRDRRAEPSNFGRDAGPGANRQRVRMWSVTRPRDGARAASEPPLLAPQGPPVRRSEGDTDSEFQAWRRRTQSGSGARPMMG